MKIKVDAELWARMIEGAETAGWELIRAHEAHEATKQAYALLTKAHDDAINERAYPACMEPAKASERQVGGSHYKDMSVQTWDVVDTWPRDQQVGYYRGGALKYLMRMGAKDQEAQEIAKGQHYMQKLLELLESK